MFHAHLTQGDLAMREAALVEGGASARALELCRRLDWRFLLPDPALRCIGYCGEPSELLAALQLFGETVTIFSGNNPGPVFPRFDTVVLRQPSLNVLEVAGRMTKPGGHIYVELVGGRGRIVKHASMSPRMSGVMKYAHALWNGQFNEIQAYWHRPGFESCREIIPLFDSVAMRFALSRECPANVAREAWLVAARCLTKMGLLPHIVPCYSLLARKRKGQASS
jgi:hypothetical protein